MSRIPGGGQGGVVRYLPTSTVRVAIHQFPANTINVVASSGETWVLLGGDVLNAHCLLLDGPQLTFEIG